MKSETLYLKIINNLNDGVYFVDTERRITFWSKGAERISGFTAEEMLGRLCHDNILSHIDSEGRPLCLVGCPLYATMIDGKQRMHEVFLRHKEGHRVPIHVNIFPMLEKGKTLGAIEVFAPNSPVVYEDSLIEQLSNMAMLDELTGLPNRRYLQSFIEFKINEFKRFGSEFALLFLDIDNFGTFNNTHGHEAGDVVLKTLSKTIKKTVRKSDLFGRWGGEEFIGAFAIKSKSNVPEIGEKIRFLVENTIVPYSEPLSVTVSVGITAARDDDTIDSLVERADNLMYKSKQNGKNCVTAD